MKPPSAQEILNTLCKRDPRYPVEAYEFVFAALGYVQDEMKKQGNIKEGPNHITGKQLAIGCRDFALQEFGMMAGTVLKSWGISRTDDFGEIVYNLIGVELMTKNDTDRKEDFHNVYNLQKELSQEFQFSFV